MASLKWLLHNCHLVFALNVRDLFSSFDEMTNDRSYCHFWQIISPGWPARGRKLRSSAIWGRKRIRRRRRVCASGKLRPSSGWIFLVEDGPDERVRQSSIRSAPNMFRVLAFQRPALPFHKLRLLSRQMTALFFQVIFQIEQWPRVIRVLGLPARLRRKRIGLTTLIRWLSKSRSRSYV